MEQLLLDELRGLRKEISDLRDDVTTIRVEVAGLKIRSSILSTISGVIGGGGSLGIMEVLRSIGK